MATFFHLNSFISQLIFDFVKYPNAEEHRKLFNELINKCVNLEIMGTFNLSAYSSIDYCLTGEAKPPFGEPLKSRLNWKFEKIENIRIQQPNDFLITKLLNYRKITQVQASKNYFLNAFQTPWRFL